jgi:hypothetical protein
MAERVSILDIDFGDPDANADQLFEKFAIETNQIKECLRHERLLITGEKGSGKTGLRRLLSGGTSESQATFVLDFDRLGYEDIYNKLLSVANSTRLPKLTVLSDVWCLAFMSCAIQQCAKTFLDQRPRFQLILDRMRNIFDFRDDRSEHPNLFQTIANMLGRFDAQIRDIARKAVSETTRVAESAAYQSSIASLWANEELIELRKEFVALLREQSRSIVLIADGFDTLRHDCNDNDGVRLVFESLVTAAYKMHLAFPQKDLIRCKILMPFDRFISGSLRDTDKIDTIHQEIYWTPADLKLMLAQRIRLSPKIGKSLADDQAVYSVLPRKVLNATYDRHEDAFSYILRHTMLRPRELLRLMITLQRRIREKPTTRTVDQTDVRETVKELSQKFAVNFVREFSIDYPKLSEFVLQFSRMQNIITVNDLREKIAGNHTVFRHDGNDVDKALEKLYCMGFFGVVRESDSSEPDDIPTHPNQSRYKIDFFFTARSLNPVLGLAQAREIALHPMFQHYLHLKPDPARIIG